MDKLLTLVYDFAPKQQAKNGPPWTISEQRGVQVKIIDYGKTESSPFSEPMYEFLEQHGYTRNVRHSAWRDTTFV